jgi:hypothetical protein
VQVQANSTPTTANSCIHPPVYKCRGPGELLGTKQSGRNLSGLAMAVMQGRPEIMEQARAAAEKVLEEEEAGQKGGGLTPIMKAALSAYGFTNFDTVSGLGV